MVLRATAIPPKMSATEMASVSPMRRVPRLNVVMRCVARRNARPVRVIRIAVVLHKSRRILGADLVATFIEHPPEISSGLYGTPGVGMLRRPSGNGAITNSNCDWDQGHEFGA